MFGNRGNLRPTLWILALLLLFCWANPAKALYDGVHVYYNVAAAAGVGENRYVQIEVWAYRNQAAGQATINFGVEVVPNSSSAAAAWATFWDFTPFSLTFANGEVTTGVGYMYVFGVDSTSASDPVEGPWDLQVVPYEATNSAHRFETDAVSVVIPDSVVWTPMAPATITAKNMIASAGTSPAVTGDPGTGKVWYLTHYCVIDNVMVLDQFEEQLNAVYAGATVEERSFDVFQDSDFHNINAPLNVSCIYQDPVGPMIPTAGTAIGANLWPAGTVPPKPIGSSPNVSGEPHDCDGQSDFTIDVDLRIDDIILTHGISNRKCTVTPILNPSPHYWQATVGITNDH